VRTVVSPDPDSYPYSVISYADPDAVTKVANGLSTTTLIFDDNRNVTQKTVDGTTTTYVWDYANRLSPLSARAGQPRRTAMTPSASATSWRARG
jgi:hypothetical protein